ncbi:MAG: hypothetical protein FWF46_01480 [Oscillospiraceae bacterium]|nr:hypothetical protein [Oscillospiraceae bacterium]
MEFLKDILGDDLYKQVAKKISSYNSKKSNKDNKVKIANLGSGKYISKAKYKALEIKYKKIISRFIKEQNKPPYIYISNDGNKNKTGVNDFVCIIKKN